ncbi:MAG: hypothetical protein Q8S15_10210 [Erysipelotrichaceae bacterium]|nr:hypothetical protein [Erysipelotrichaceae bacterium]MDP3306438.1 hypothetical protein [Erysipelotrichaceae bacterium]
MANYTRDLEMFFYTISLIMIAWGLFDMYRMDRLIDNDLKVKYFTVVWSKISLGLISALYIFILFWSDIIEHVKAMMPIYVLSLIVMVLTYFVSRLVIFTVKKVLTIIYR